MKPSRLSLIPALLVLPLALATEQESLRTTPSADDPSSQVPAGMAYVAGGKVTVGLSEDDIKAAAKDEQLVDLKTLAIAYPKYEVELQPYYIDLREVTNEQWQIYLEATGTKPSEDLVANYWTDGKIPEGHEKRPIVYVSQREAMDFCKWAMKRLPTEFEWEFAARGPQGFQYPWGNEFDDDDPRFDENGRRILPKDHPFDPSTLVTGGDRANCGGSKGRRETKDVGSIAAGKSPFGLFDMAGNVWEWTSSPVVGYPDHKQFKFSGQYLKNTKISGAEFFDSGKAVLRGGAYDSKGIALMSAVRQPAERETWFNTIGFRAARSVKAGLEAIEYAHEELGPFRFRASPIDHDGLQAFEVHRTNEAGLVTGYDGLVFAPVKHWLDKKDRPLALSKAEPYAKKAGDPLPVGILKTTHDLIVPRVPAGTYMVAWQAPDKSAAKEQKDLAFPAKGWNYPGLQIESSKKKKSSRKSKKDAPDPDQDEDQDKAAPDPDAPPAPPPFVPIEGSLDIDRDAHNLVLLDQQGKVIAALAIDKLKENAKPGTHSLERLKIAADKRNKIPATEMYRFHFVVETGRKAVPFTLPLQLAPDLF